MKFQKWKRELLRIMWKSKKTKKIESPLSEPLPPVEGRQEKIDQPLGEDEKVTAKDFVAMNVAALFAIFLPCILILGVLCLVVMTIFGAFS